MKSDDVFENTDPVQFITAYFQAAQERNHRFSLRSFAKRLGCTVSTLSRILSGKRPFTIEMGRSWVESLNLTPEGKKFFILLILKRNSVLECEKELFDELLLILKNRHK